MIQDFSVVQWIESSCHCRGHRFDPRPERIPHATEQLSPCTTATEVRVPRARSPQQEKPPQCEAHTPQLKSSPCSLQLKTAHKQP